MAWVRPRTSTLVLIGLFIGVLALYVLVRPDPVPTVTTVTPVTTAPAYTPAPTYTPSKKPSPNRSPSPSKTPTPSKTPRSSPSPSPSPSGSALFGQTGSPTATPTGGGFPPANSPTPAGASTTPVPAGS